jgi:hypothetical protein
MIFLPQADLKGGIDSLHGKQVEPYQYLGC